jgi:hypothetical protein
VNRKGGVGVGRVRLRERGIVICAVSLNGDWSFWDESECLDGNWDNFI